MNTIKIYLTESGRIADLQKDFPLYQGQFQNKLLNVFVPTSILAPIFTSSGAVSADYVASTSTKIGMTYTARDGSIKTSKNYYMRYLKTLMYKGVEYALYERKLPKEFTFYAGQGENSPVLIINVVNIEQQSGDTPPLVLSVITSQTCHLDVMQSTFLDRDELDEPSELENLNAQVQALNALMPKKQDKEDENIALEQAPAEKTVVGAINELGGLVKTAQSSADTAQQTAETAQTTADNATTLANNAVATANNAVATANEAKTIAEQAKTIATNSVYSVSFEDIQSAVTALNGYDNAYFKVGNSIYLKQKDVPDMWVYAVASEYVEYTYTTDYDFVNALLLGTVQVGYYVLANLESTGDYDVLKNKPIINQDLSADGFAPVENTYYRHTGTTSETYTAGVIYFYNGTAYKAIDGAGGEVPTSLPVKYTKLSGTIATTDWESTAVEPYFLNSNIVEWGSISVGGSDISNAKMSENNLGIELGKTYTFNVSLNGVAYDVTGTPQDVGIIMLPIGIGGTEENPTYQVVFCDQMDLSTGALGTGSAVYGAVFDESVEVTSVVINSVDPAIGGETKALYTLSNSALKTNSAVTMYIDYNGKIKAGEKTDGSITVSVDETPTENIPYTLQVVETSAEGAFEIVNSYLPTIPETPTALPQEASALKSGSLPTSGWTDIAGFFFDGNAHLSTSYQKITTLSKEDLTLIVNNWGANKLKVSEDGTRTYTYSLNSHNEETDSYYLVFGTSYKIGMLIDKVTRDVTVAKISSTSYDLAVVQFYNTQKTVKTCTISDTSITANSDILMELTDEGGVKAYSMEAGKITVIRDTVPTQSIPYTYKVKQTNAAGQFTVINHFTPSIPESPTSLPVTYKKASGSLPTSGWEVGGFIHYWEGEQTCSSPYHMSGSNNAVYIGTSQSLATKMYADTTAKPIVDYKLSGSTQRTQEFKYYGPIDVYSGSAKGTGRKYSENGTSTKASIIILENGEIYGQGANNWPTSTASITVYGIGISTETARTYTISDTSITANTSVKMYLTDEGGVKAYSKESGAITVIRDEMPTSAIPYEYEVEETSAEGLFEVINAYVPTKTSDLQNDSGFITAADIGNALYPVGSIYMSVNNTNPSTFFGGTWEAWGAGRVPVGVDTNDTDFATVEKTGGEKTHILTESEMPKHSHGLPTFHSNPEKENITFADTAFNADKASDGTVGNGGRVISAGGGQAHNNLQPYITCYMWKRTA